MSALASSNRESASRLSSVSPSTDGVVSEYNDGVLVIRVAGEFDRTLIRDFRCSYEGVKGVSRYVVDLSRVSRFASAGLGMLLVLKDYADSATVRIENAPDDVRRLLSASRVSSDFEMP